MPFTSPSTKMVTIFVSIAATTAMMTMTTNVEALADPAHCDKAGWPSCYDVGNNGGQQSPRTGCPIGHSSNFCDGWNTGARTESNNNNGLMHALDTPQ